MALRYRISKRVSTIGKQKEQYILQAASTGTVDLTRIAYEISNECSLTEVDVKFVLDALGRKLKFHLEDGKTVDIDNIGRFKVGFKCKAEDTKELLSPKRNILRYHLNFQPCVDLKRWLKKGLTIYKKGSTSL